MLDADAPEGASNRCQPAQKGALPRRIGRTKGGLNSKLHRVTDGQGRPLAMLLTEGQASDYRGTALLLTALPPAKDLIADKGHDGNGFRNALAERGIADIPSSFSRRIAIRHEPLPCRQRHKIEIMFGRPKDWRRIHTRYDRRAHAFFSAICIAATVIFWLKQ